MDYYVAIILNNLLAFLYRILDGPSAPEWQGALGACRAMIADGPSDPQGTTRTFDQVLETSGHSAHAIATASPQQGR